MNLFNFLIFNDFTSVAPRKILDFMSALLIFYNVFLKITPARDSGFCSDWDHRIYVEYPNELDSPFDSLSSAWPDAASVRIRRSRARRSFFAVRFGLIDWANPRN